MADLDAVRAAPAVGERVELSKGPVSTTQLVMYAGASGDFNRIHYDLPFARSAGLDGVIAHGLLSMGFAAQMLSTWAGARGFVRSIDASFRAPVRPGDVVALTGIVQAVGPGGTPEGPRVAALVAFRGEVDGREVITGSARVEMPAGASG